VKADVSIDTLAMVLGACLQDHCHPINQQSWRSRTLPLTGNNRGSINQLRAGMRWSRNRDRRDQAAVGAPDWRAGALL